MAESSLISMPAELGLSIHAEITEASSLKSFECLVSTGTEIFTRIIQGKASHIPDRLLQEKNTLLLFISCDGEEIIRRLEQLSEYKVATAGDVSMKLRKSFTRIHTFILPRHNVDDMKSDTTGVFPLLTELINLLFSALALHIDYIHADKISTKAVL